MKFKNYFWGLFFIAAAAFIIVSQTSDNNIFTQIGFWSIVATVFLVAIFIDSIVKLHYFGIFAPVAILYSIYQKPLDLPNISFWQLIFAAILISIGLHMLFHRYTRNFKCWKVKDTCMKHEGENITGNRLYSRASFCQSNKYLHSDSLEKGEFSVSFGQLNLYFDQVQLSPEGAEISIDCNFAGMTLYVPKHWIVIDNLSASIGGVDNDTRFSKPAENSPRLTLSGSVHMSGVEIKYI
jgi:membrane protein implicated in regulation of membrane protease activity